MADNPADALKSIPDPLRRFRAAADAKAAAEALYAEVERAALLELVEAHGGLASHGAISRTARELGVTPQAVSKRLKGIAVEAGPVPRSAADPEPARYFANERDAEDALRDWALAMQSLNDRRDTLVRGSLAVGLTPRQIRELTDLSLELLDRLGNPAPIETAVRVDYSTWEDLVEYLVDQAEEQQSRGRGIGSRILRLTARNLAGAVGMVVGEDGRAPQPRPGLSGPDWEALDPEQKAELMMSTPLDGDVPDVGPDAALLGPDGWTAWLCTDLERQAAECTDHEMAVAMREAADAVRHVRRTGTLPATPGSAS